MKRAAVALAAGLAALAVPTSAGASRSQEALLMDDVQLLSLDAAGPTSSGAS